ncbi:hypothetical protein NOJ28_11435 [Neorhizobium galegae]|uniref:hypothetical protein n=1 Tax=Neorhizobium galegae TaxID=399 RepID=UPI002102B2D7|nr:hypothetical protein [Neorhizobium galegae]MCQ1766148.1 hypothetical protein [Neorhizobium galegae]MCQ1845062.1 hypothetical protein [Neorhizobium galegae]
MTSIMAGEALPSSEIHRLLRLHRGLNELALEYTPMSEEAMDHIIGACGVIEREIIRAPTKDESDVADKFRFLAELIDDKSGASPLEDAALATATAALANLRARRDEELRQVTEKFIPHIRPRFQEAAE